MQEYYKIYFPYSKEYLLEQIKKTTKPLCISNQAYRDMALAAYKEEDNTLCIGYAAGSMTGGGWEMLQTHIKSYGGDVVVEYTAMIRIASLCSYFCSLGSILGVFHLVKYFAVKKWEVEK
mgnify:CR=1 FL=1